MIKKPEYLTDWNFSDTVTIPDGYNLNNVPDMTRDNFNTLIEEHNNLVTVVNLLCEKAGVEFNEGG